MAAAWFVGRVGGLAVALGVGTAILTGYGVASAEPDSAGSSSTSAGSTSTSSSTSSDSTLSSAADAGSPAGPEAGADHSRAGAAHQDTAATVGADRRPANGVTPTSSSAEESPTAEPGKGIGARDTRARSRASEPAEAVGATRADESSRRFRPAPAAGGVVPADAPSTPADAPTEWLAAAVARRDLAVGDPISSGPITVEPTVELDDGVIVGDLNATDTQNPLFYTVIGGPSAGGKLRMRADGSFSFLPDAAVVDSRGTEVFTVMVSEKTALVSALDQVPLIGPYITELLVQPILVALHQVPVLGSVLRPLIGYAVTVPVVVDINAVVPVGAPVAFTTRVVSFDGTLIRANFFPASGLLPGQTAPTIFDGPGLAAPGSTNPRSMFRNYGYNVVTWDPRGEFDSGGVLYMDSPFFEGRDMSALFDWLANRPEAQLDGPGDPRIGMVGASYGGGIQLVTAATDHRVDAIVPEIAWNSLNSSLYKDGAYKTAWGTGLFLGLLGTGARLPALLYEGVITGNLLGVLSESVQAFAASSGPSVLVNNITAPTLLIQGTVDTLFTLQEATTNAQILDANGVPVKMIWYCGGHGECLSDDDDQYQLIVQRTLEWLEKYIKGNDLVHTGPKFEFVDQNGDLFSSEVLPSDPAFYGEPVITSGGGGVLPIVPLIGGSGPQAPSALPYGLLDAAPAFLALNLTTSAATLTTRIVGAPQLTFTYSGLGTSRHIYAQLVDDKTGLVLGNIVTPVPVVLDGHTRTVTVSLEQVAQTMQAGDTLTLQLVGSAFQYQNSTSVGVINVSDMHLTLPTANTEIVVAE